MDNDSSSRFDSSASTVCETDLADRQQDFDLCTACQGLEIGLDKFLIGDSSVEPVYRAPKPKDLIRNAQRAAVFSAKSRNVAVPIGSLREIEQRSSTCSLCWLLYSSVPPEQRHLKDSKAFLNWEIDGRGLAANNPKRLRSRRLHVRWTNGEDTALDTPDDAYLVHVALERAARRDVDFDQSWSKSASFMGRTITPTSDSIMYVKSWLDICLKDHNNLQCQHQWDARFDDMIDQSFFGVVDVLDMCLTSLPKSRRGKTDEQSAAYFALSYVWGPEKEGDQRKRYTTTRTNVLVRCRKGGLEKDFHMFPKVVQDAVALTRRLGQRYLWIDALCIVQDSHRSWQLNADYMDTIYGNAMLTICAADGDSTVPLKAMHPAEHSTEQHIRDCAGVRLMVSHLAETGVQSSKWNTRAWTFQERLLSRRALIFVRGRVFFQCASATRSEDIVAEPSLDGWSLNLVQSLPRVLRKRLSRPFWVYMTCMTLYSSRNLTKEQDVLAAFSGFSNTFGDSMNAPFVFGLPSSHFDLALLWQPTRTVKRRGSSREGDPDPGPGAEFPSWSWCGWRCGDKKAKMEYNTEMLQGCLYNVRQWLLDHTWIHWYIRDGHGRLRALWPPADYEQLNENPPPAKEDLRWQGYEDWTRQGAPGALNSLRKQMDEVRRNPRGSPSPSSWDYKPSPHNRRHDAEYYYDRAHHHRAVRNDRAERKRMRQEELRFKEETLRREIEVRRKADYEREKQQKEEMERKHDYDYYNSRSRSRSRGRADEIIYPSSNRSPSFSPDRGPSMPLVRRYMPSSPPSMDRIIIENEEDANAARVLKFDAYGRELRPDVQRSTENGPRFKKTTVDSPHRVVMAQAYDSDDDDDNIAPRRNRDYPDQPLLQFWTWSATLRLVTPGDSLETTRSGAATPADDPGALRRFDITDDIGDWCGSVLLDPSWVAEKQRLWGWDAFEGSRHEFLALSEAKGFTEQECEMWNYYVPRERDQSEWDLYYVMLVEVDPVTNVSRRVALGKVFKDAFQSSGPGGAWKEIILG